MTAMDKILAQPKVGDLHTLQSLCAGLREHLRSMQFSTSASKFSAIRLVYTSTWA